MLNDTREPLEVDCLRLVASIEEVGKVGSFVGLFLITNILSDDLLVLACRRDKLSACPKMISLIAAACAHIVQYCRLALQKADKMRRRILRRDRSQILPQLPDWLQSVAMAGSH